MIGVGRGGGAACGGSLSLILVGCALELAYAGIVNGSGRSDINFLKYSYIMGQYITPQMPVSRRTRNATASSQICVCSWLNSNAFEKTSSTSFAKSTGCGYSFCFSFFYYVG